LAVKITKGGKDVGDMQAVLADFQKRYGEASGNFGGLMHNAERVPTGLFPFDLATGGGLPRGRCTILYGPEDSGKTSVVYGTIAQHQRIWPDQTCVYVAIEPFDGPWAQKMGVDLKRLAVLYPSYAEEAVDMTEAALSASDAGFVAVDSLAAMITTAESEKSAEGNTPGGAGLVVGKLVRKTTHALREAEKAGRIPTLCYINQVRHKIGVMYGSPETIPGGFAPLFQAQLRARFYGKAIKDSKISDQFPIKREVNFMLKKMKVPILSDEGKFEMVVHPHNGLRVGETDDINTITSYLKEFGAMEKGKSGWTILSVEYPTIKAFQERVYTDRKFGAEVRDAIIQKLLTDKEGEDIADDVPDFSVDENGEVIAE
jgi:recombination protein RecA